MLKKLLSLFVMMIPLSAAACANDPAKIADIPLPQLTEIKEGEEIAVITTNFGEIKIRFFPEYAPLAVKNFITHAKEGYYDGVIFHRVITGFMIQGGDPLGTGYGGESIYGDVFANEVTPSLRHIRGAVSMANAGPNTNGSQFFIVQNKSLYKDSVSKFQDYIKTQDSVYGKDASNKTRYVKEYYPKAILEKYISDGGYPDLDFSYSVFGQVFEGLDVVDKIAGVRTGSSGNMKDRPLEDVVMESIKIVEYTK